MSRDQGRSFANIFRGNITRNPLQGITISGEWADVPLGAIKNSGTLIVHADGNPDSPELTRTSATGNFGALTWTKLYDVPRGDLNAAGSPSRN